MATQKFKNLEEKLAQLSSGLRKMIRTQEERDREIEQFMDELYGQSSEKSVKGMITRYNSSTMLHCNSGALMDAALQLKRFVAGGGKIAVSLAGALSTFQCGISLTELIRRDIVQIVSATGANHEESYYRYVAHSWYAYIPKFLKLSVEQEAELRDAGFRRITDTFLPEEESVRIMEPHIVNLWQAAQDNNESHLPHEYFRKLLAQGLIKPDPKAKVEHCWAHAAFEKNIPIMVPGFEDSTMGNIFSSYTYAGKHKRVGETVISNAVMKPGPAYMHMAYDWYMETSQKSPIAFLQLGGGIAADFLICVVPSLKHDLILENVRDWAMFIEVNSADMAQGSYSGAGGDEKITWDKLSIGSFSTVVKTDATIAFPIIAAALLDL